MTFDEYSEPARHAKLIKCPRCRRSSLVLMFDSPDEGMVCPLCHDELIVSRREGTVLAKKLHRSLGRNVRLERTVCVRCGRASDMVTHDPLAGGMCCRPCQEDLAYLRQEFAGLIPDGP